MSMHVAIVGSRDYSPLDDVRKFVRTLPKDHVVVSGGARGVDWTAEGEAIRRGLSTKIFKANWRRDGKAAGFIRNKLIVGNCDYLVAFWDGESKGTAHTISLAKKAGKLARIYQP